MNALKESYADYVMPDGLIEKTTFYAEPDYKSELFIKEIYKHRLDKLISVDTKFTSDDVETVEYFSNGREDYVKCNLKLFSTIISIIQFVIFHFFFLQRTRSTAMITA